MENGKLIPISKFLPVRHDCRHFNGYKPCSYRRPCQDCPHFEEAPRTGAEPILSSSRGRADADVRNVLVLHYGAMGAVLQSTALLPALRRKYPKAEITWVTDKSCFALLSENPFIKEILPPPTGPDLPLPFGEGGVRGTEWDVLVSLDKGREPAGLASRVKAGKKLGFGLSPWGNIAILNPEAAHAQALGLDDGLKFKTNQRSNQDIWAEMVLLPFKRDPYVLELSAEEKKISAEFRAKAAGGASRVIGINTGCADNFPYKKLTIARHVELVAALLKTFARDSIFLLGGKAETERNKEIAAPYRARPELSGRVVETPTTEGLRRGMAYENACDLVISGDTLGMHIGIALKKKVVAWFSLTCDSEIDLYDRGVKLRAEVTCGPCWLSSCSMEPKCYDKVPVESLLKAVQSL